MCLFFLFNIYISLPACLPVCRSIYLSLYISTNLPTYSTESFKSPSIDNPPHGHFLLYFFHPPLRPIFDNILNMLHFSCIRQNINITYNINSTMHVQYKSFFELIVLLFFIFALHLFKKIDGPRKY